MSTLAKSLRRLYRKKEITKEEIQAMKEEGKITPEEEAFILEK